MIKSSAIRGKIERSNLKFTKTRFWFDNSNLSELNGECDLLLQSDEEILIFSEKSKNERWILTNFRLFIPEDLITFKISELSSVVFDENEFNQTSKFKKDFITLKTDHQTIKLVVEEGSWYLFMDIFKFIISGM